MLPLGTLAPNFDLPEPGGKNYRLEDFRGKAVLVVMFLSNHCPYVKHIRKAIAELARSFVGESVAFVAINANDVVAYPEDSPEKMVLEKRSVGYGFPYLFDSTQAVAKAYQAACTPDFFVFNRNRELYYRGQFDDSRPSNREPVTGADLERAIRLALQDEAIPEKDQIPSMGCNIKWKRGNEPKYFGK